MPPKKEAPEKDSSWYAYVCEHRASNDPCDKGCHSTPRGLPDPEPFPDDWLATAGSVDGGLTDSFSTA